MAAASCPQVQVIFARGRYESPGPGVLGNAFENALASKVNKSISNYAVKYPADTEVDIGANDMSHHIQDTANNCPDTRIVLGGYSLGAAVTDVVLAAPIGAFGFDSPLPPGMDQHIAAVALFGNGTQRVLGPVPGFSPAFAGKTIEQCAPGDPICSGTGKAVWASHLQPSYIDSGLVDQAAAFAAGKL